MAELELQERRKKMAAKTVDPTFLQGQSVELLRAAIKSHATRDPSARREEHVKTVHDGVAA
jgi:hypothetical protein